MIFSFIFILCFNYMFSFRCFRLSVKLRKGLNIIIITSSNLTISLLRKAFSCWRPCNAMQVLFSRRRLGSLRCKWFDCRTLQTAVGVFGGGGSQANGFDVDGETAVNGDKFAKIDGPPIIAVEHCRERWVCLNCPRLTQKKKKHCLGRIVFFRVN